VALPLGGYVGITGWFLAHAAANLLKVGPSGDRFGQAEPADDPLALGYRGDPLTALGLPFQTVTLETPLGPAEAWLVPAAGPEVGRAIYVHGIAGAREDGYRALSAPARGGLVRPSHHLPQRPRSAPAPEGTYGFGLTEWPDLEAAVA
jgi:uncharacterized protein